MKRPASAPALVVLLIATLTAGCLKDKFFLPETSDRDGVEALDDRLALEGVASGFSRPLLVLPQGGEGGGDLLVVEQPGTVRTIAGETWLDVTDRVGACHFEQGLLGLAFAPGFPADDRFWIAYTDECEAATGDLVLAQGRAEDGRGIRSSLQVLLTIPEPYRNHNGGHLAFGPDGMLYLGVGDGGSHGDPNGNGQDPDTRLGTLLRLDVDRQDLTPQDNPFVDGGGDPLVWAYGLRNPWRFSFDRETGDLWIGDVGQNDIEEIDLEPAGSEGGNNYGWSRFEGRTIYSRGTQAPDAVPPVHQYSHAGGSCSVTGGHMYRGQAIPEMQGTYVFGDYCSGNIWGLQQDADGAWKAQILFTTQHNISSFGEDGAGELYVVAHGGRVLQIVPADAPQA